MLISYVTKAPVMIESEFERSICMKKVLYHAFFSLLIRRSIWGLNMFLPLYHLMGVSLVVVHSIIKKEKTLHNAHYIG
jgi:hypothetical protein